MDSMQEVKNLLDAQNVAWETFRKTNDERLAAIEKGQSTADFEAKLAKINTEMDAQGKELKGLVLAAQRPATGTGEDPKGEAERKSFNATLRMHSISASRAPVELSQDDYADYKSALNVYLRKGKEHLTAEEFKAINVGTDPQGGYLVTNTMESTIDRVVARFSGLRSVARVIPIGTASYKKLVKTSGTSGASIGGETQAPTEGTSQAWSELEFRPGTYISDQRITSEALEDAVINVESDLTEEMGIEFAELEGQHFVDGSGVNRPRGLLSYTFVANASYSWGNVGYVVSGGAAGFAASNPSDALIDLQHGLKRQYRAGASWVMNDATLGAIRKFKDGQGLYLWAPSALMQGAVGQLLGHPVVTDDFMPDVGTNTYPIAFGDFNRAYYVIDRRGIAVLRDPYSAVPYVKFVARRRVGGGIANFEAVKVLKCSA